MNKGLLWHLIAGYLVREQAKTVWKDIQKINAEVDEAPVRMAA